MLKWIFFDVGNVILNDDPAMTMLYQYIYDAIHRNGKDVTIEQLLSNREQLILQNRDGRHYNTIGIKYLGEKEWRREFKSIKKKLSDDWEKISPLLPGVDSVIQQLSTDFNLGLIANQPREVVSVLEKHDLMKYFKVNAVSAYAGFQKPDSKIFKYALDAAKCQPEESVMIGDRIDNDILPAKAMGMRTIWLKLSLKLKGYQPVTEFEKLYFQSIRRASAMQFVPRNENERPDFIAESYDDLTKGLAIIKEQGNEK